MGFNSAFKGLSPSGGIGSCASQENSCHGISEILCRVQGSGRVYIRV